MKMTWIRNWTLRIVGGAALAAMLLGLACASGSGRATAGGATDAAPSRPPDRSRTREAARVYRSAEDEFDAGHRWSGRKAYDWLEKWL